MNRISKQLLKIASELNRTATEQNKIKKPEDNKYLIDFFQNFIKQNNIEDYRYSDNNCQFLLIAQAKRKLIYKNNLQDLYRQNIITQDFQYAKVQIYLKFIDWQTVDDFKFCIGINSNKLLHNYYIEYNADKWSPIITKQNLKKEFQKTIENIEKQLKPRQVEQYETSDENELFNFAKKYIYKYAGYIAYKRGADEAWFDDEVSEIEKEIKEMFMRKVDFCSFSSDGTEVYIVLNNGYEFQFDYMSEKSHDENEVLRMFGMQNKRQQWTDEDWERYEQEHQDDGWHSDPIEPEY